MGGNDRIQEIVSLLKKNYPKVKIALQFKGPYQLLVATILSAQCTDVRVNEVTPAFFKKYKDANSLAQAKLSDLERLIKPTGFYKNKALSLKKAAKVLVKDFNGRVPSTMEGLTRLPGVARKTANVVLFNAFGKREGIAVDTHVKRLSQRLGFTRQNNPDKIEQDLIRSIDREDWGIITLLLMAHGRKICTARSPKCSSCFLKKLCPAASRGEASREELLNC
jgi:endonuclease-3